MRCIQSSVAILAIAALVLTVAVPDADHHGIFAAASSERASISNGQGAGGPFDATGESMHHCLACAGSSQRIVASDAPALFLARLLNSITVPLSTLHHLLEVDLHSSGKRSPPLQ
jgi:hypothetical protein